MSGFLYFIDGLINPLTETSIAECGLGYAFESKPQSGVIHDRTPSGASGTLLGEESRFGGRELRYSPDQQTWRKVPGQERVYVGYHKDAIPGPATLARTKQMEGEAVRLADGAHWLIPRLRFWAEETGFVCCLRGRAGIDDDGNWIIGSLDAMQTALNQLADRLYGAMVHSLAGNDKPFSTQEALDAVTQLLAANYHVSKIEVGMLEILPTDDDLMAACRVAMDFDKANEWAQKKTEELAQAVAIG